MTPYQCVLGIPPPTPSLDPTVTCEIVGDDDDEDKQTNNDDIRTSSNRDVTNFNTMMCHILPDEMNTSFSSVISMIPYQCVLGIPPLTPFLDPTETCEIVGDEDNEGSTDITEDKPTVNDDNSMYVIWYDNQFTHIYKTYYTIYITYSCIIYCYLFLSNIFYIMYIATQTHMNLLICIQWNGMPAGSPYM